MSGVRVRFAPSPTGHLHVGGARTALFNYLFARSTGGRFILRIEDTDLKRSEEHLVHQITDALQWLSLDYDEGPGRETGGFGPYYQSRRLKIYHKFATKLLEEQKAYRCFCAESLSGKEKKYAERGIPDPCLKLSQEEVRDKLARNIPYTVKFRMPKEAVTVYDIIRGTINFPAEHLDDMIILKTDGFPTYNFACCVDDALMEISHVIRAEDHLSNTPKQIQIYRALGFKLPKFAHLSLIMGPDGKRLSKRHGATSIAEFKKSGYLPEALVNYLALLGWSDVSGQEIFSLKKLEQIFSLKRVRKTAAIFDYQKLNWFNSYYLKCCPDDRLVKLVFSYLKEEFPEESEIYRNNRPNRRLAENLVKIYKRYIHRLDEFPNIVKEYLDDNIVISKDLKSAYLDDSPAIEALTILYREFLRLKDFQVESLKEVINNLTGSGKVKAKHVFRPLRVALTGKESGPDICQIMEALGKERVLYRLNLVIKGL